MGNVDAYLVLGTKVDKKGLEEGIEDIENKYNNDPLGDMIFDVSNKSMNKIKGFGTKVGNFFTSLGKKILSLIKTIGTIIKIGAIATFALSILGIVASIAGKFSELLAEDKEFQADIQYIGWALREAVEPIAKWLVSVVKWLLDRIYDFLGIIGGIVKLLFGIDIFAQATANNFKKANSSAKEMRKTLAGFDEMTILNANGTTGIGGNIADNLDSLRDLNKASNDWMEKIKKWLFHGEDNLIDGIKKAWGELPSYFEKTFKPVINLADKYIVKPFLQGLNIIKEKYRFIWEPLLNKTKEFIDSKLKPLWQDFFDNFLKPMWDDISGFIQEKAINPIKSKFDELKDYILRKYAPFINQIIDWINYVFGAFGIHLDHIKYESEETTKSIWTNFHDSIDNIKNKAKELTDSEYKINLNTENVSKTKDWVDSLTETLKKIESKKWTINASFNPSMDKDAINRLFQPMRENFAKMGFRLPMLATGGIINYPSKGVPIGGAIGGESGMEGVIPLTDSQQMELLGASIGRHVTINLTNITDLDGRQLAREVNQINASSDFLRNR